MGQLILVIATLLGATWRVTVRDDHDARPQRKSPSPFIYCFWHSALLPMSFVFRRRNISAIVSASRDGKIAATVARGWGHGVIFGSSSRGGTSAMRDALRTLAQGGSIAMTPDGPRGPAQVAKPGVAQIAAAGSVAVVPLRLCVDRAWRLGSWDGFIIPKPFSRVTITVGRPLTAPKEARKEEAMNHFLGTIQEELDAQ